jgi:hypothetical protein
MAPETDCWAVAEFGHDYDEDERQARAARVGVEREL